MPAIGVASLKYTSRLQPNARSHGLISRDAFPCSFARFQVAGQFENTSSLQFGYGGYQEARGSGISSNHYYVDGVMEELDTPGESVSLYIKPRRSL